MVAETSATVVDIVRHGEHQLGRVVCGITDPGLTEKGWQQLQSRIDEIRKIPEKPAVCWDLCVTSPRKRCREFAESLAQETRLDCVVESGFAEVDFGNWEGLSFQTIHRDFPGQWQYWIEASDHKAAEAHHNEAPHNEAPHNEALYNEAPHGGEKYAHFLLRVQQSWSALIENNSGKSMILFAHGGVIRAIFRLILGLDCAHLNRISVPHACHTRIVIYHYPGKPDLPQLNLHNTFL